MKTKISICIATWNSERFLEGLFESIFDQDIWQNSEVEISVFVVDSGSRDSSVAFVQNNYPQIFILKNNHNLGFAKSYNQCIRMQNADFYFVINADIVLEKDYLSRLYHEIKKDDQLGSVSGKVLRARFAPDTESDMNRVEKTNIIDSLWIEMHRNRQFSNFGENELDSGQYDKKREVFGFSPVATLYSHKALEKIKYEDEYFDEDFFSYKEDIDLSWRLQIAGFRALFLPSTTVYHFRTAQNQYQKYTNLKIASKYKNKSDFVRLNSYRNHLCCLLKNETDRNFWRDSFFIIWYEFRKLVFLILFDRKTLKGLFQFFALRKTMIKKKKKIMKYNKIRAEKIRDLFVRNK
jgi:GT2 family glycosyltransferase